MSQRTNKNPSPSKNSKTLSKHGDLSRGTSSTSSFASSSSLSYSSDTMEEFKEKYGVKIPESYCKKNKPSQIVEIEDEVIEVDKDLTTGMIQFRT